MSNDLVGYTIQTLSKNNGHQPYYNLSLVGIRTNLMGLLKGHSILDSIFLSLKPTDCELESNQSMVILSLDFEKAYDKVEKDVPTAMGFDPHCIIWTKFMYVDS